MKIHVIRALLDTNPTSATAHVAILRPPLPTLHKSEMDDNYDVEPSPLFANLL